MRIWQGLILLNLDWPRNEVFIFQKSRQKGKFQWHSPRTTVPWANGYKSRAVGLDNIYPLDDLLANRISIRRKCWVAMAACFRLGRLCIHVLIFTIGIRPKNSRSASNESLINYKYCHYHHHAMKMLNPVFRDCFKFLQQVSEVFTVGLVGWKSFFYR